jgi:hypothetical protein
VRFGCTDFGVSEGVEAIHRSVGIGRIQKGIRATEHEILPLDRASMEPGEYLLQVTVMDMKSDRIATRRRLTHIGS